MNQHDRAEVIGIITGYWPVGDKRAIGMVKWLEDRGVTPGQARGALSDLAEQYDMIPSIKQLSVKLAELGTHTKDPLGVGAPAVIERMKTRIMEFTPAAAEREGKSLHDRLVRERAQAVEDLEASMQMGLDESQAYGRDQITAYDELLKAPAPRVLPEADR